MSQPTSDPVPSVPPSLTQPPEQKRWFMKEVHPHEPVLRSYLYGAYPDLRDVDDVVQESFLRIWKANAAKPIRSAKAFLFEVARHLALDLLRRRRNSPLTTTLNASALSVLDPAPNAGELACSREEITLLAAAIHTLPPRCREIIILRKLKSVPQKEIAARLGLSEKTVQVQVVRGVKRIGEILRAQGVRCPFDEDAGALTSKL